MKRILSLALFLMILPPLLMAKEPFFKQEKQSYMGGSITYTSQMYTELLYAKCDDLYGGSFRPLNDSTGYSTYTNLNKPGISYSLVRGTYWDSMTVLGKEMKNFGYESALTISSWFPPKLDKGIFQYCGMLYFNPVGDFHILAKAGAGIEMNTNYQLEPQKVTDEYWFTSIVEKNLSFALILGCDAEYRIIDHLGLRVGCDLSVPFLSKLSYTINRVENGESYSPNLDFFIFGLAGSLKPHVSGVYFF